MREDVVFKGNKAGLQLVLNEAAEFNHILSQLRAKLESAAEFFGVGTTIKIPFATRILTVEQQNQLTELFADYGLSWKESPTADSPAASAESSAQPLVEEYTPQTLVVTKTLRGGQEVVYSGSIVIIGDVNPGAKISAGGDITIHGACRGVVHAGAFGNLEATITANTLLASQIRIADHIARAPDVLIKPECVETARVKNGEVIIEPAVPKCV